ncbi:MAG: hypothetical protein KAT34_02605 [Candidatus Aminicenantes bacterium]|nr:hypothetical protein [Candidatus Aminicenantes bacterium]
MKQKIILMVVLLLLVSFVTAEDPSKQILKPGDVERFIKTFPLLKEDMEKFNMKYEAKSGDVTIPEALKVSSEFLKILKKHGWDENFWQKFGAIMMGYSSIVYGKEMKKADIEMEKSLKELDSNPNIPDSMKKQLKEQLKAAKSVMQSQGNTLQMNIHPSDLSLITPHIKEIREIVDDKN